MRIRWWLAGVALLTATAVAGAAVTVDLRYDFEAGAQTSSHVTASIDAVEMGADVPLAVTGNATVDLTLEVTGVEAETATLRATFGEVNACLLEEQQEPSTPDPVELRVTPRGVLSNVDAGDTEQINLFASGGVPLQLVVLLAGVVEMPEGPVAVGESWSSERCQQIPDIGEMTLHTESRLVEITGDEMTVTTDLQASLPDFTTDNPMQKGEVTFQNGVLTIEGMERTLDVKTGLIKSVEAEMLFDGFAALGPIDPLPLSVTSSFAIEPAEAAMQAAGTDGGEDG